jgi:hypothetical protein
MKLTSEQIEDILAIGEAKAALQNKKHRVYLLDENPMEDTEVEENTTYENLGYVFEFRPEPEQISRGFSTVTYHEIELFYYWQTTKDGQTEQPEVGLPIGYTEFLQDRKPAEREWVIKYDGQKYASWEPFAKSYGITELVTFATKIPRPLAIRLQKTCEEQGETPSWRIRLLIQNYLTEQIETRARRVLFEG